MVNDTFILSLEIGRLREQCRRLEAENESLRGLARVVWTANAFVNTDPEDVFEEALRRLDVLSDGAQEALGMPETNDPSVSDGIFNLH
jgi:hypothetical protein